MTFNSTTKTYRIILQADVPIFNPNYLQVGGFCGGTGLVWRGTGLAVGVQAWLCGYTL